MRIGMQTWGSHGDIRPFLALAAGLSASGHDVSLAITSIDGADYARSSSETGFKIQSVATPVVGIAEDYIHIGNRIFSENNPVKQAKAILDTLFVPVEDEMFQASEQLCLDNELVIGHYIHYAVQTAAEKIGRPYVSIMLAHNAIPSSLQPPVGIPSLGKLGNRISWWIVRSILNKTLKPYPDRLRAAHGLRPTTDLISNVWASRQLTLVAVSTELCHRKDDWPDYYRVCGFLDMPNVSIEGQVSAELEEFLSHGDSPVYVTFGSLMPRDVSVQRQTVSLLSDAVTMANCRAIIQAPLWKESGFHSTDDLHFVTAAPHKLLFPRCKVIIHHGGAGTTQSAMLAGKPSIVVAHIAEQEFWGRELEAIGVAPGSLRRRTVTKEQLAKSIKDVLGSDEMKEKAETVGAAINRENGVEVAVQLINEKFGA